MNIAFVNTGHFIPGLAVSPPLGVMSLAAWVRSRIQGTQLRILDQAAEQLSYEALAAKIIRLEPDVVALSYMSLAASFVPPLTRTLRSALPNAFIVLGGPHPSAALADGLASTDADALVPGEGELAFEMILQALDSGGGLESIPGLFWRNGEGVVCNPGSTPVIDDLDALPIPAYDLVELPRYWDMTSMSVLSPGRNRYVTISSSRGCPYRCTYCHEVFGKSFRAQSPDRIVEEIKYLQKLCAPREIYFVDDIFNLDKRRVIQLSEQLTSEPFQYGIHMTNGLRTDILTEEVVDAMVAMGLRTTALALESGSRRIQKLIKKNLNIPKFLAGVEMMARRRVYTYGFTMLGFPTETAEEMRLTIDTAAQSMLHRAWFFKATPYPGTGLYEVARELCPDKLPKMDYVHFNYEIENNVNFSSVSDDELFHMLRIAPRIFSRNLKRLYRVVRDDPEQTKILHALTRPLSTLSGLLGYKVVSADRTRLGHEVA